MCSFPCWLPHVASTDDELLETWHKVPAPLMEHPHTGQVNAWRDPWFVERGGPREGEEWTMLIGSGVKGAGGIVLVYRSADFTKGKCTGNRLDRKAGWTGRQG